MIHVLSAHLQSARWLSLQLRALEEFIRAPFQLVWSIEDIREEEIPRHKASTRIVPQCGDQAGKLNALAQLVIADARAADLLVFLDGDALPVGPLDGVFDLARRGRLVAVRRDENDGDPQPHPSFCAVSVRQWRAIGGNWEVGPHWRDGTGAAVTDVGARLWATLRERRIEWTPLLRTVHHSLHPVWFGVYANIVYHHGAAFRFPRSRADAAQSRLRHRGEAEREDWLRHVGTHSRELGELVYARLARLEPHSILSRCRDGSLFAGLSTALREPERRLAPEGGNPTPPAPVVGAEFDE
ncbi:MAG: hypothetical protein JO153_01250 [Solirubrobacterales bacterium]|nr:hypothetical protein [Solirubrobacterales bacterium]